MIRQDSSVQVGRRTAKRSRQLVCRPDRRHAYRDPLAVLLPQHLVVLMGYLSALAPAGDGGAEAGDGDGHFAGLLVA